jgi:hypothetical protein
LSDTKPQYLFLVNHDMSLDLLQRIFQVLSQREILFCIVGERTELTTYLVWSM